MNIKLTPSDFALWAALPIAQTSKIESRITMILGTTRRRMLSRRAFAFSVTVCAAALVPLAMLKPAAKAQPSDFPTPQEVSLHLSRQQENLRLTQARQLREHLAGWAKDNKAALLQMQQAQPDDLAALMPVYRLLEKQPLPLWNDDPRIGKSGADPGFSAQTNQLTLAHLQRSQESTCKRIRQEFGDFHDFRVSQSIDPGAVSIIVWASGRITESTLSFKFMGHGKPFLEIERQKVLMPPFFSSASSAKIGEQIQYAVSQ